MGKEKKVLVVVLALDAEPWRSIEERGQRSTWAVTGADVPILWLHGINRGFVRIIIRAVSKGLDLVHAHKALKAFRHATGRWAAGRAVVVRDREIRTRVPETYLTTNAKTVAAFRHLLATQEFDYILRTNSSSYVHLDGLKKFVQDLPDRGFYGGAVWQAHGLEFITGSTIILSRDLVEYAVQDDAWEFDLIDDMALGKSMARAGVEPKPVRRTDVLTSEDLQDLDKTSLSSSFLVRCKGREDREHDILAMQKVHEFYGSVSD